MENDETSRGRGKNKIFWSEDEVKILVAELQELAVDPSWKTDGGFKSNYLHELHRRITQKMPSFTKQVDPHMESKTKWLKTKYHAITEMLKESGCSWNADEQKIKCEKEWYMAWIKRHKEAKGLWDMRFQYLDDLVVVYGRDRATGQNAQGFFDAINIMETESHAFTEEGEQAETTDEASFANAGSSSIREKRYAPVTKMNLKKKTRVVGTSLEQSLEKVGTQIENCIVGMSTHFASIAASLADENKRENKRDGQTLIQELEELGLESEEIFEAGEIIGGDEAKMRVFFHLTSIEMKKKYVRRILSSSGV